MKNSVASILMVTTLLAVPALAQTTAETPATTAETTAPTMEATPAAPAEVPAAPAAVTPAAPADGISAIVVEVPEGYILTEPASVTADELKGVDIYDPTGNKIAEIADVAIGGDSKVTGIITDVGGFLGLGEHRISLAPDQVAVYKNADNDLRAYVSLTKDELKAMPKYEAPNQ